MAPSTSAAQKPTASSGAFNQAITLPVPYLCQRDSATSQGLRMCFSSTCAMAAGFLRPGCLAGDGQPDDRYLALVQRHGDTTDAAAQVRTLRGLGIQAEFRTDGRIEQLIAQLRMGIPVPVGWLHNGAVTAPRGGGPWSMVTGWSWWCEHQGPRSDRFAVLTPFPGGFINESEAPTRTCEPSVRQPAQGRSARGALLRGCGANLNAGRLLIRSTSLRRSTICQLRRSRGGLSL